MKTIRQLLQRTLRPVLTLVLVAAFGLSACDALIGSEGDGTARLSVRMIDAPFPFDLVDSANVTITRVDVHSETAGSFTVSSDTQSFNLLDLREGVSALLGEVEIDAGTYDQVRLEVEDASIVLTDGTTFDMKVPSERIKVLLNDLEVGDGEDVTLTIDFDVSKSFVVQGNPVTPAGIQGFLFKPTVVPAGIERKHVGEDEDDDETLEVEGTVEAVGAEHIEVDGASYAVTSDTRFEGGDFASLEEGMYVEIEYVVEEDGSFTAVQVEIESEDDDSNGDDSNDDDSNDG